MDIPAEATDLIASLRAEITALRAEVADLRRRLNLDSSNSSKPPSSDGLKKKPRIAGSLRGRSGKPSGGQTGHEGGTLRQVANPDAVVRHEACACRHCGLSLDAKSATGIEKRQVFDIPERPLVVTEHRATIYRCTLCRGVTKAAFPEGIVSPTQYGERIRAAAIYLNVQQLIPEDRVAQTMSDLSGQHRRLGGQEGARVAPSLPDHRPACGGGHGSPSRRNRVSHRWQAALVAHNVELALHLLSRGRKARRYPQGFAGRRRRARPLHAVSRDGHGRSRLLQRACLARASGSHRDRRGDLGRTNAPPALGRQRRRQQSARGGRNGAAAQDRRGLRRAVLGCGSARPLLPSSTAQTRAKSQRTRTPQTTRRPKSAR